MNINEKDIYEIKLIGRSYISHKRRLLEAERKVMNHSSFEINCSKNIVDHIETIVNDLNEKDRFIIENEVVNGKEGKWYLSYLSTSTYYRQRKKAYRSFLNSLEN